MLYRVLLEKEHLYYWDEDRYGEVIFTARTPYMAQRMVATLVEALNRRYARMGKPRNVRVHALEHFQITAGTVLDREPIALKHPPYTSFRHIRMALGAFFKRDSRGKYRPVHGLHAFV